MIEELQKLGGKLGAGGLLLVPCMAAHLAQIVADSILVGRWQQQDSRAHAS